MGAASWTDPSGCPPLAEPLLAAFCRERLAAYKVPRHIRLASQPLPRTAAGKLLRRALPRA